MNPEDPEPAAVAAWLAAGAIPPALDRFVTGHARDSGILAEPRRVAAVAQALDGVAGWATTALFARSSSRVNRASVEAFAATQRHPRDLFRALRSVGPRLLPACLELARGEDPGGTREALLALSNGEDPVVRWQALLVRAGVPPWHVPAVAARAERSGEAWTRRWLDMLNRRPPRWVRVVDARRVAAVRATLADEGLNVLDRVGNALALRPDAAVARSRPAREGLLEVQSLASQWVGEAVPLRPEAKLWLTHAGRPDLVMHLHARLGATGALWVTDPAPPRLASLRRRLARAGVSGVRTALWDGLGAPRDLAGAPFDAVVVDPTGGQTGAWRQAPDARLRAAAAVPRRAASRSATALAAAAAVTAPGGVVLFAPGCLWVAETDDVVDHFLATHPGWSADSPRLLGAPEYDTDTHFAALLRRDG